MPLFASMAHRVRQDELMDDPRLSRERHELALRGLSRLNRISGSARIVWRPIQRFARQHGLQTLRVLDVATGSGDIPIWLWRKSRRRNLSLEIVGVDISPKAVEAARERAGSEGACVTFRVLDALVDDLPTDFDVVTVSLFLHHLENEQIVTLLRKIRSSARRLLVVNDLIRSRSSLLAVHLASRLLTRSDVVRVDGPLSVRAGFRADEIRKLADQAGLDGAQIALRRPCRFVLQWSKP